MRYFLKKAYVGFKKKKIVCVEGRVDDEKLTFPMGRKHVCSMDNEKSDAVILFARFANWGIKHKDGRDRR